MATELTAERLAELRRLVVGYAETADRDWNCKGCGQLDTRCRCAEEFFSDRDALLRAAEERERMQTWVGLMSLLDQYWPDDVFPTTADDAKRDDGARIVSLLRWVDRLRAENETLRKRAVECMPMLETLREALGTDLGSGGGFVSVLDGIDRLRAQRDALVAVLQSGQSLRTHDLNTTERWVIDDVDEVCEALRAAKPEPAAEPAPERHHRANVCGIRRKSDGYWWQCDSEHGAGWNDKRIRQAWTMRAAHAHIADMRAKGMLREEVEVVELVPAEPVPAAADAKPAGREGDEVLRDFIAAVGDPNKQPGWRINDTVAELCRRALGEVRP